MARLKALYNNELKQQIQKEIGVENVMQVPKITKITLNMGVGGASQDKKLLEGAVADMTAIAGQKPVVTKARKSVAGFKIREEQKKKNKNKKNKKKEEKTIKKQ